MRQAYREGCTENANAEASCHGLGVVQIYFKRYFVVSSCPVLGLIQLRSRLPSLKCCLKNTPHNTREGQSLAKVRGAYSSHSTRQHTRNNFGCRSIVRKMKVTVETPYTRHIEDKSTFPERGLNVYNFGHVIIRRGL